MVAAPSPVADAGATATLRVPAPPDDLTRSPLTSSTAGPLTAPALLETP